MKPLLIYDGDCGFCSKWIERWKKITQNRIDYQPYQIVGEKFPQLTKSDFEKSVILVEENGARISKAAEAVFRSLGTNPVFRIFVWLYNCIPPFRWLSEMAYAWIANNRYRL